MPATSNSQKLNDEIVKAIHLFSNEAFAVAKLMVAGDTSEALKQKAGELKSQLPGVAARMQEADPNYRADLNRALSEARLDLEYVLAGGGRPSSIRLSPLIQAKKTGK